MAETTEIFNIYIYAIIIEKKLIKNLMIHGNICCAQSVINNLKPPSPPINETRRLFVVIVAA